MTTPTVRRPGLALLLVLLVAGGAVSGCRGRAGEEPAADADADAVPLDGEGMEPRILTEQPIDSPGRPALDRPPSPPPEPAAEAAWVPHLTVRDLEESAAFYRRHGFTPRASAAAAPRDRLELSRDGARLVLVAAAPAPEREEEESAAPAGDPAPPAEEPPVILHLVGADGAGGGGDRTLRDPDGHPLALPEGG